MITTEGNKIMTNGYGKGLIAGGLIVAGGLIGAALGILYAPRSGKETREGIRHSTEELLNKAKDQYQVVSQGIEKLAHYKKESYTGEKERLNKALEAGGEAYNLEKTDSCRV
ncbi:MAG: YtxH domain-containing protein [Syntrophales bacterium]|nr:YtxH domain-containing protein [Syntrophales bacterium]